jgi:hypothetical protein
VKFTNKPVTEHSKKSDTTARTCSWRAEPTLSRELSASTKETIEFKMNNKEKTEMEMKVRDEEDGFFLVLDDEACGGA